MKKIHLILVLLLLRFASYGQPNYGTAVSITGGYRMTSGFDDVGTYWDPNTVNFDQEFTLNFNVRITPGPGGGAGADGICAVFAANPPIIALDRKRHRLGYFFDPNLPTAAYAPFDNKSLAVRYDNYFNSTILGDLSTGIDNVSINQNASYGALSGPVPILSGSGTVRDGAIHNYTIKWRPPSTLEVLVDGSSRLLMNSFCPRNLWTAAESENITWGFTASTGGSWAFQDITDINMNGQPKIPDCVGLTTTIVTPGASGGTWSSSNGAVATVNASGVVTGVTVGTATITHDITSPCPARLTYVVDVKTSDPGVISVPSHFCEGDTWTCSSTHPGGTWSCSSSPAGLATINPSTGVLTITNPCSTSPGSVTITYTLTTNGCPASTTVTVPVYSAPNFKVFAPDCVCAGEPFTLYGDLMCDCSGCTFGWTDAGGNGLQFNHDPIEMPCSYPRLPYDAELTVTSNGCAITQGVRTYVYPKPEAHATTATTVNICGEGTALLGVESCGGTGEWSIVEGDGTIFGDPLSGTATYTAADVVCSETVHVRYHLVGACSGTTPGCPPVDIDYYINVKPRPSAELTILSCDPLCPGTDATVQVCGSPGSTVYCRYTYPGCGPINDTITLIPSPCDLLGPCQTIVLPRPAGCPATTGLLLVELLSVELNGCARNLNDAKKITIGYPTATIALVNAPCGNDPYCISITGTPGARVYLSEMFSYDDPSVFPAHVDLPTTGVSVGGTTTTVICGLVIPDLPSGRNRFCITKIEMPCAGGCTIETAPTYVDELHHPLGCIDVISKPKPQFDFGVTGTVCPPSPFTLNAHTYSADIDKLLWTGPVFWSATTMPVPLGDHFQTVSVVGPYEVTAVGTNGCQVTKFIRVAPSPQASVFVVSVDGSLCDQAWGTFYVTLTGNTGSVVNYKILPSGVTGSLPALPPGGASFGVSCMGTPGMTFQITSVTGVGMCPDMGPFTTYPITVNPAPVASLTCSGSICAGPGTPTLTFSGTPGAVVTYGSTPSGSGSGSGVVPSSEVITPPPAVTTSYVITDIVDPATLCHGILPQQPDPCTIAIVPVRPDCPLPTDVVRNAAGTQIMFNAPVAGKLFQSLPGSPALTVGVPYPLSPGATMFIINIIQIGDCSFGNYDCRYYLDAMDIGSFRMATSSSSEEVSDDLSDVKQNVAALSITPNPNTGTFKLSGYLQELTNLKEVAIEINDMLGKTLLTSTVPVKNGSIQENIAMREVANGVYMVKIKGEHVSQVLRFVIDK